MKLFSSLVSLFFLLSVNAESLLIAGFESEREVALWRAPKGDPATMTFNVNPQFITSGRGSAKFSTPKAGSGESRWPQITLGSLPTRNWRMYDELTFDVVNPGPETVDLHIQLLTGDNGKIGRSWLALAAGRHQLVWKLPDIVGENDILGVRLFQNDPPTPYTMYVDNMQIRVNPELFKGKLNSFIENLEENDRPDWDKAGLRRSFDRLKSEAGKLDSAGKLVDCRNRFEKLKVQRNQKLNAIRTGEFNRHFPGVWGYGVTHGMEKVFRCEYPFLGQIGGNAVIAMARNEREPLQVVLHSKQNLKNVSVSVGKLVHSKSGSEIPAQDISVYTVGYVKPLAPVYPVEAIAWYPDPLLDFLREFDLEANVWQPVWIDIYAPAGTPPGQYRSLITVKADNAPVLQIPLEITVWNFTLPQRNTRPAAISHETQIIRNFYADAWGGKAVLGEVARFMDGAVARDKLSEKAARIADVEIAAERELLRNRITPSPIYNWRRPVKMSDIRRWRDHGGSQYNIMYIQPDAFKKGEPYYEWRMNHVRKTLNDIVPKLREAGVLDDAYIYCFDEITESNFYAARTVLEEVKKICPEVPVVTTAFDPTFGRQSGLDGLIDIWVPNEPSYAANQKRIQEVRRQGKKVWYYTCMYRKGMNFLLEASGSAPRLLVGLAQFKTRSDGFLYYHTTMWNLDKHMIAEGPLTRHSARSYQAYNGDGLLLYPGKNGALPTVRLKNIGDGLEDLEYWFLLKKLKESGAVTDSADIAILDALLAVEPDIVTDFGHFDLTGDKLNSARLKAGALLDKYPVKLN